MSLCAGSSLLHGRSAGCVVADATFGLVTYRFYVLCAHQAPLPSLWERRRLRSVTVKVLEVLARREGEVCLLPHFHALGPASHISVFGRLTDVYSFVQLYQAPLPCPWIRESPRPTIYRAPVPYCVRQRHVCEFVAVAVQSVALPRGLQSIRAEGCRTPGCGIGASRAMPGSLRQAPHLANCNAKAGTVVHDAVRQAKQLQQSHLA